MPIRVAGVEAFQLRERALERERMAAKVGI